MSEKENEPKCFSRYVKTHDQDHQELKRKLEQKQDLFPLHKGVHNKPLMNIINELGEKLDSHIDDFQLALREIIYKHINKQGDEYGEDIEELLRMMDGFKKKLGKEVSEKSVPKSEEDFYKSDKGLTDDKASADLKELHNELNETKSVLRELQNEFDIIKTILPHLMDLYARNPDFMNELGLDFTKLKKLGTEDIKNPKTDVFTQLLLKRLEKEYKEKEEEPHVTHPGITYEEVMKGDLLKIEEMNKEKEPPQNQRTFEENFERVKKKEPPLASSASHTEGVRDPVSNLKYMSVMEHNIPMDEQKKEILADLLNLKKYGELDKCMKGDILTIYLDDLNELIEKLQQEIDNYKKDLETTVSKPNNHTEEISKK